MPLHCVIKDCNERSANGKKGWALIPKDGNRRMLWLAAISRKDFAVNYEGSRVCPKHFILDRFIFC